MVLILVDGLSELSFDLDRLIGNTEHQLEAVLVLPEFLEFILKYLGLLLVEGEVLGPNSLEVVEIVLPDPVNLEICSFYLWSFRFLGLNVVLSLFCACGLRGLLLWVGKLLLRSLACLRDRDSHLLISVEVLVAIESERGSALAALEEQGVFELSFDREDQVDDLFLTTVVFKGGCVSSVLIRLEGFEG